MDKSSEIYNYCLSLYNDIYQQSVDELTNEAIANTRGGILNDDKLHEIENLSQLKAIKEAIKEGRRNYPHDIPLLWGSIYKAHLYRKSGIADPVVVQNAISAEQSWRSSSGHAFEELVKELGTLAMRGTPIQFILQRDLNILLKAGEVANAPRDISWLKEKVKGQVFDVYVVADKEVTDDYGNTSIKKVCFGCAQCKTSIRDRVSRDIVPSREAMDSFFWSIGFVLDGEMLSVPKYQNMVNGNVDSEFKKNGWHGFYDMSATNHDGRIYAVDLDFNIIREHTLKAYQYWTENRQWFNIDWIA